MRGKYPRGDERQLRLRGVSGGGPGGAEARGEAVSRDRVVELGAELTGPRHEALVGELRQFERLLRPRERMTARQVDDERFLVEKLGCHRAVRARCSHLWRRPPRVSRRPLARQRRWRPHARLRRSQAQLPPLRERWEDIPALAGILFSRYSEEARAPVFSEGVTEQMARHHWPGNVRELENEMRRLATLGDGNISPDDLSPGLTGRGSQVLSESDSRNSLEIIINQVEREAIESALKRFGGNKSRAAHWLSITRKALYRRLRKYGIHTAGSANGEAPAGD